MANKVVLKLIQEDIRSVKSQIDVLRMETKAYKFETLAYLLDLAYQEVLKTEIPGGETDGSVIGPLIMQ